MLSRPATRPSAAPGRMSGRQGLITRRGRMGSSDVPDRGGELDAPESEPLLVALLGPPQLCSRSLPISLSPTVPLVAVTQDMSLVARGVVPG